METRNILTPAQVEALRESNEEFLKALGLPPDFQFIPVNCRSHRETVKGKILCFADLHEPYCEEAVLRRAYEVDGDAETVIIAGDISDYFSKSRWMKKEHRDFLDEARAVMYRLRWLSSHFPEVLIMQGNHDDRPEKRLARLLGAETDLLLLTEKNLLGRMISFFPNLQLVGHTIRPQGKEPVFLPYIHQIGDLIFSHAEISLKQGTAVMERISSWLRMFRDELHLPSFNAIAQAHNHRLLKTMVGSEQWYLVPTCSDPYSLGLRYAINARMMGQPQQLGWSVFYQNELGETIFSKSELKLFRDYQDKETADG